MFKALVIICVIMSPQSGEQCYVVRDALGPYNTLEKCTTRIDQMAGETFSQVNTYFPVTSVVGVCEPLGGELS